MTASLDRANDLLAGKRIKCPHTRTVVGVIYASNGARQVKEMCVVCRRRTAALPHGDIDLDSLPVLADNRKATACAHCGSPDDIELHHFAPKHLFDDADRWPTAYLCRPCHQEWHRVTSTGVHWPRAVTA